MSLLLLDHIGWGCTDSGAVPLLCFNCPAPQQVPANLLTQPSGPGLQCVSCGSGGLRAEHCDQRQHLFNLLMRVFDYPEALSGSLIPPLELTLEVSLLILQLSASATVGRGGD